MSKLVHRLGICVICGDRVHTDDQYLKSAEGYCHNGCLSDAMVTA